MSHAGAANQAHLGSHSGHGSSFALSGTPTNPEFKVEPQLRQFGASPCCVSQVRKTAHQGLRQKTLARNLPGGGSHCAMQCQVVRDMDIAVSAQDERAIEVLAFGLPLHHGAQFAVDVTLRCALTANGEGHPNAAAEDGAVC